MLLRDAKRLSLFIGPILVVFYLTIGFLNDFSETSSAKAGWREHSPLPNASLNGLRPSDDDGSLPAAQSDFTEASFDDFGETLRSDSQENDRETFSASENSGSSTEASQHRDDSINEHSPEADIEQATPEEGIESESQLPFSAVDELPTSDPNDLASDAITGAEGIKTHQEIFSLSTPDRQFFHIDFGKVEAMNPNIIPHPHLDSTWIVVAQRVTPAGSLRFSEIFCNAAFEDGFLRCIEPPSTLPIAPSTGDLCKDELDYFQMNIGPHDARVFMGPKGPLVVYGSNSIFTCFGQFVQDLRALVDWGNDLDDLPGPADFRAGTELQRPPPWNSLEKNWFLFWDTEGRVFVHHDIVPKRVFTQLNLDGSVSPDLSVFSSDQDAKCMEKLLPQLAPELESIHQATNSLQITLCKREDTGCIPDDGNTFIFVIFQHKTYYDFHSVYEPYVMLFRNHPPFDVYAISRLPLWIHGREQRSDTGSSDMFYVTSMSWKARGQKYDGYLDDEMFLAFGIEDAQAGGIDLQANAVLEGLQLCEDIE